jgi:hypothetical protein
MKVIHRKELKNGKRHALVELDASETLVAFDEDGYYKMGHPFSEVVRGNHILESAQVTWCVLGQEWVS